MHNTQAGGHLIKGPAPVSSRDFPAALAKQEAEKILGLELGADDYVTKPSPDGKYLAYLSRDLVVGIRSVATGEVRELSLWQNLSYVFGFGWASDSGSFLIPATDAKGRNGIFRIEVSSDPVSTTASIGGVSRFSSLGLRAMTLTRNRLIKFSLHHCRAPIPSVRCHRAYARRTYASRSAGVG